MSFLQGSLAALSSAGFLAGLLAGVVLACGPVAYVIIALRRYKARLRTRHAELAATHRRNQSIVEYAGEGMLELDNAGNVRYANPAAVRLLGYEPDGLIGLNYKVLINTHLDAEAVAPARKMGYTTDMLRGVGALLRRKNGEYRPVDHRMLAVTEEGTAVGTVVVFRDITERVRLDNLLKDMQTTAMIGGWEYELTSQSLHCTEAIYAMFELPFGEPIDLQHRRELLHPDDQDKVGTAAEIAIRTGAASDLRVRMSSARGRNLWVRLIIKAERRGGVTLRLHGTVQDITDLVVAERQLRETRDFYELTLNAVPTPINYYNRDFVMTYANRALEDWLGKPVAELIGKNARELATPDTLAPVWAQIERVLRGEAMHIRQSGIRSGVAREWQNHFVPQVDANGEVIGFFSIVYDLTEQKRLEARLLQAQKMEAIGQLTGGIAHDFNNLLGVVIGNLQLLERSVAETPTLSRKVHTAMRAAVRGADLTRRLLTFARRQILDPTVLDLNRQLSGLSELMQRTLGESIEVRMVQSHDLWHTRVDAGQFENAILNLAINARDAMPEGGRLTVRTQNAPLDAVFCHDHPGIEPGEFVSISVSDTGVGMDGDVLQRAFEPFFTTKESGKGSGLGLAMVHSFAEQSGGVATIESQVGQGTTVQILLPRCFEQHAVREDTIVTRIAPGGNETILVVEDDADLRETVVTALSQLGYRALAAANAAAAIRILSGTDPIDLLFTDVMMPGGMLGPALAKRAREMRPDIEVLFTTGYAENTAGLTSAEVIAKPYRNEELAMRIRHLLDREARVA